MAAERLKVEVGFEGGQVLPTRLNTDSLKDLRAALEAGAGWVDLDADDGMVAVDVARIVFLRINSGGQRVGF